jgi:hypothetical protein
MTMTDTAARRLVVGSALAAALVMGGCATVQPWQRGRLSDPCMVFDSNLSQVAYTAHWQESREGAAGGLGVQGGGCGCK